MDLASDLTVEIPDSPCPVQARLIQGLFKAYSILLKISFPHAMGPMGFYFSGTNLKLERIAQSDQ